MQAARSQSSVFVLKAGRLATGLGATNERLAAQSSPRLDGYFCFRLHVPRDGSNLLDSHAPRHR